MNTATVTWAWMSMGLALTLFGFAAFPALAGGENRPPKRMLVAVDLEKSPSFKREVLEHFDVTTSRQGGIVEVLISPGQLADLSVRGCSLQILRPDVYAEFESQKKTTARGAGNLSLYFNYDQMKVEFQTIASDHPTIANYIVIGSSLDGNDIFGLKISDNPAVDEEEPEVLYCALHHSREPVSGELMRSFANYLTDNYGSDTRVDAIVNGRELWIIPIVNPDGYIHVDTTDSFWRKNRRGGFGVDLNRNYGFEWAYNELGSSSNASSQTYRGLAAFSEPETQAIRDLVDSREFVFSFDCHTYGDLYLPAYGYSPRSAEDLDVLLHHGENMAAANSYSVSPPPLILYGANGVSIDYCYETSGGSRPRILAISPEVGPWFYPAEAEIPGLVLENREPMLYLAEQAGDPYGSFPPNPSVLSANGPSLSWSDGNAHGRDLPVQYEIQELSSLSRVTEDFDSGGSGWRANGFGLSGVRAHSGATSFYSGNAPGVVVGLEGRAGFHVQQGDELSFWTWYALEQDFDYAYVQVSTDGGVTFENLAGSITTASDPEGYNAGSGITGSSNGWVEATFSLQDYEGQEVRLRFEVITDGATNAEGFYVDDVFPREEFASVVTIESSVAGSSYLLTGHSSGTFSYRIRGTDDDSDVSEFSNRVEVEFGVPALVMDFETSTPQVRAGERVRFTATINNGGTVAQALDFWLDAEFPDGSSWAMNPVVDPRFKTIPGMSSLQRGGGFRVSNRVNPGGPFRLYLRAGSYPVVQFEDSFEFTIVP